MKQEGLSNQKEASLLHIIDHPVAIYDTLEGISLSYGVPIADIKRWNKLLSDSIIHLKILKIAIQSRSSNDTPVLEIDNIREEREIKIQTLDILTNEFGAKILRSSIEKALLVNQYDLEKSRKYINKKLECRQKARHFAIEHNLSEVCAYNLLMQANWNYQLATKLFVDGTLYLSLDASNTSKLKLE